MAFSRSAPAAHQNDGSDPKIRASMYFAFGRSARPGLRSKTTFEAILAGERTSTTRFPAWGGFNRWLELKPGDHVRFYANKEMLGRYVDVIVEQTKEIDLATCAMAELREWSAVEGWTEAAGRDFGRRYGAGLQITYRLK